MKSLSAGSVAVSGKTRSRSVFCLSVQYSFHYIAYQFSLMSFPCVILLTEDDTNIYWVYRSDLTRALSSCDRIDPILNFFLHFVNSPFYWFSSHFLAFLLKSSLLTYCLLLFKQEFFQALFSLYNVSLVSFIYSWGFDRIWMLLTLRIISLIQTSSWTPVQNI